MLGLENATITRIDQRTGAGPSYTIGADVAVRCVHAKPGTLFTASTSSNQQAFSNIGRLYVSKEEMGGWEKLVRGWRIRVEPDDRTFRFYVVAYVFEHDGPSDDLDHYEIELVDESVGVEAAGLP